MAHFDTSVEQHMVSPVHATETGAKLADVYERLLEHKISSLPVLDGGKLVGVISRTDLLRVGRSHAGSRGQAALLTLPDRTVADAMTRDVVSVPVSARASDAARKMVDNRVHRVYVTRDGRLAGVFGTRDIMLLVRDKKANAVIGDSMSNKIFTINEDEPISLAAERLEKSKVTGILVVENDWPVGIFTQIEALESRDLARNTPVDEVMNPALVCLPHDTKFHRAAAQATKMRVRRVVACEHRKAIGIVSGLDFARLVAG